MTAIQFLGNIAEQILNESSHACAKLRALESARTAYSVWQAQLALSIDTTSIIDDGNGGKRAAKNQGERDAVLTVLQATDARAVELKAELDYVWLENDVAQRLVQALRDEQTNYREVARYMTAEINLRRARAEWESK